MPVDRINKGSTDNTVCIDLIPRTGHEPSLDLMFKYVQDFLRNIGCIDGIKILSDIFKQIESQNRGYELVIELQRTIDQTLSSRFGIDGLITELNIIWLNFLENQNSDTVYTLPIPERFNVSLLNALFKFLGRSEYRTCDDSDRILVSIVYMASMGMIYKDDRKSRYLILRRFDSCFQPFKSRSSHPILEDIRHSFVHNNIWISESSIHLINEGREVNFEYTATREEIMKVTFKLMDSVKYLPCSDDQSWYVHNLTYDIEPFLRKESTLSKQAYLRCLEMTTVLAEETMWTSFEKLFKKMKRNDETERFIKKYLHGTDVHIARNTIAHEWFWDKTMQKWFLNGERIDMFLLKMLILSEAPFVEASILGIGEAVRHPERVTFESC